MCGHCLVEHRDRRAGGLTPRDVGGDRVAGVVVDELEDHALAPTGEHVLGRIELPARVRCGVHEPAPCRAWLLLRLEPCDTGLAEDPCQRRDRWDRGQTHRAHLVVHADRPMVQTGGLQRSPDLHRLGLDLVCDPVRARLRPSAARLQGCGRAISTRPGTDRVERLARRSDAPRRTSSPPPRRISRPVNDRETDTRINRLMSGRHRQREARSVTTKHPECVTDVLNRTVTDVLRDDTVGHDSEVQEPSRSGFRDGRCARTSIPGGRALCNRGRRSRDRDQPPANGDRAPMTP